MNPVCFHVGGRSIHWYGVMMALGFIAGLANWHILSRKDRTWPAGFSSDLAFWVMIAGVAGARVAYVGANFGEYAGEPLSMIRVDQGGLIFYGGFVGAALALAVFARVRRIPFLRLADFTVTAVPLAHALGRIGCFINGCCYGRATSLPLGVRYPAETAPWADQVAAGRIAESAAAAEPVHPVQIYEAVFNLALYALLLRIYTRGGRRGLTTVGYLLAYPIGRFALEFLRGDQRDIWCGLHSAQVFSLALFATGILLWFLNVRSHEQSAEHPR